MNIPGEGFELIKVKGAVMCSEIPARIPHRNIQIVLSYAYAKVEIAHISTRLQNFSILNHFVSFASCSDLSFVLCSSMVLKAALIRGTLSGAND